MNDALVRLRTRLAEKGWGAILVSDPTNIGWLTGFSGSFARVLVTQTDAVFITDSRYTIQASEEVSEFPVVSFATPMTVDEVLKEQIAQLGIRELAFESASTTVDAFTAFGTKHPDTTWVHAGDLFADLRMVKFTAEIAKIQEACRLADACFAHVLPLIQIGVREIDVAMAIDFFFRKQGAESAFTTIAVSGERSARPHGVPSEKPLADGDFLTMDFGAKLDGYNSDITRTVVVGHATDRHHEVYHQVLAAQLAALDAFKPGAIAGDIDRLAREVLDQKSFAQYFGHGLGHGLGRLVHDSGRLGSGSKTVIEPGQVWTVEPGVYIEGFGGVRIEDDVVVTETGITILTHSTKELLELPAR